MWLGWCRAGWRRKISMHRTYIDSQRLFSGFSNLLDVPRMLLKKTGSAASSRGPSSQIHYLSSFLALSVCTLLAITPSLAAWHTTPKHFCLQRVMLRSGFKVAVNASTSTRHIFELWFNFKRGGGGGSEVHRQKAGSRTPAERLCRQVPFLSCARLETC